MALVGALLLGACREPSAPPSEVAGPVVRFVADCDRFSVWQLDLGTSGGLWTLTGTGAAIETLIGAYPEALAREELARQSDASPTSSSYANNLGFLRSLRLIDYRQDGVVALPVLFLEGSR